MPWRGRNRQSCIICGRPRAECGSLSARGKCELCGVGMVAVNAMQLHEHSGPFFDHWRRRTLAAFGVVALDEPPQQQ